MANRRIRCSLPQGRILAATAFCTFLCISIAQATLYEVGNGKPYTSIGAVPWESIVAGDTVNIYYRTTPYKEKFAISAQGTAVSPILIHGVPDAVTGALPVIDGNEATTRLALSYWNDERCVIKVGGGTVPPDQVAKYITFENLEIKNGLYGLPYTCDEGTAKTYIKSASSVYVCFGENITVRNCVFDNCSNGFFVASSDDPASRNILMESCYIYDNGVTASTYEHGSYNAAINITYQYNHYGRMRDGCNGGALKDRSAGMVVRYNWLDLSTTAGNRQLDFVEGQDSVLIRTDPNYTKSWCYGNVCIEGMSGNRQVCHYGGDSGDSRGGTLYFYNNTVVNVRTDRDTIFRISTAADTIDARNNILYTTLAGSLLEITSDDSEGTCNMYNNWLKPGYTLGGATVNQSGNVTGTSPAFVDENGRDYHLATGSPCINAGTTLHADCAAYPVTLQYVKHRGYETRPSSGNLDIGAYEYTGGGYANLVVTTNSLLNGVRGVAYSQPLEAVGGLTPYSWSLVSGSLPSGLSLASSGVISGTPAATGTSNFTVRVTDSQGTPDTDDQPLMLIIDPPPDLVITTTALPTGYISTAYSQTVAATGGLTPYTWSVVSGSLPPGLSLGSSTGIISGTPTTSNTYNFTVRVTDAQAPADTDDQGLSIVILQGQAFTTTFEDGYNGYAGTADAWINPDDPDANYGGSDSGHLQYGTPDRQLLRFDLSSIPSNAQVHSATMSQYVYNVTGGTPNVNAYRVLKTWDEMQVTYNSRLTGTAWTSPGLSSTSDYNSTAVASSGNISAPGWANFTVSSTVAGWVSGAYANEGVVTMLSSSGHLYTRFSEYSDVLIRPKLVVNYTAPASGVQDLQITTTSLPGGSVGIAYSQLLSATGGVTPYTWSVYSGSLPSGLSVNSSTGLISGTPTTAGSYNFTIRCTDNASPTHDTDDQALSIGISAPGDLVITTTSLPNALKNAAYSQTLTASGGLMPYSWSIVSGSLPSGLSLSSSTGVISGTPTTPGTSNFTVRVTDSQTPTPDTDDQALSIIVLDSQTYNVTFQDGLSGYAGTTDAWLNSDAPTTNFGGDPSGHLQYSTPDRQVLRFDVSSIPSTAVVNSATLSIYAYDINTASATIDAFRVITHWDEMQVTYNNRLTSTAWGTPGLLSGTDYASPAAASAGVADGGAWANFNVGTVVGQWVNVTYTNEGVMMKLATSAHVYTRMSEYTTDTSLRPKLTVNYTAPIGGVPDLQITTTSLPNGQIGVAYNQTLAATGGVTPYTWSVLSGSLPAGLSLGSSTGTISGTPTTAGTSNFTVRVTDSQGTPDTDDQALSIAIPVDLSVTTSSLPNGQISVAYSQALAATGGVTPYSWSLVSGSLPAGLSLSSGGVISGTPTTAGTSSFTVRVTDSQTPADTATKALSITISPADLVITTTTLPNGTVGAAYSQTLAATGGVTPYSWSVISGSLPAGLSLGSSTGTISGTPTAAGTSNFTARVTDSQAPADTDDQALSITIASGVSPTYEFSANDTEASTTSTAWQTRTTLTFTPSVADDWVIFGFAEYKGSNTNYSTLVRMQVDATDEGAITVEANDTTDYRSFGTMKVKNLTAASHTITLGYRSENAAATAYIRNARVVAVRKAALEVWSNAADSSVALTTTLTNYVSTSFTPASAGDYLLIATAEASARTDYSTQIQAKLGGTVLDDCLFESKDNTDYFPFISFTVANCAASAQTFAIAAAKETGSASAHNIRRARVAAIRLSGGRFASYQSAASDGESTTTSTTFQNKLTKSWSVGSAGNWLLLSSYRVGGTSASYSIESRAQVDDATTMAQPLVEPNDTTDYINGGCVDVRNLASGTRMVDVDYRSENAAATAKIRYVHLVAVPLN